VTTGAPEAWFMGPLEVDPNVAGTGTASGPVVGGNRLPSGDIFARMEEYVISWLMFSSIGRETDRPMELR
jgi:hypothetical protein